MQKLPRAIFPVAGWQGGPGGPWPPLNVGAGNVKGAPKLFVCDIEIDMPQTELFARSRLEFEIYK